MQINFRPTLIFSGKRALLHGAAFFGVIASDQISKYLARSASSGSGSYSCNSGVAFGILLPEPLIWSSGIALILFFFRMLVLDLCHPVSETSGNYRSLFLVILLAGALSNLADRALGGCITDFIRLGFWPAFNLADLAVVSGVLGLLVRHRKI